MNVTNYYPEGIKIAQVVIEQHGFQNGPLWFIDSTFENISRVARQINSPWQEKLQNYDNGQNEYFDYICFVIYDWHSRTFVLNNLLEKRQRLHRYDYCLTGEFQILSRLVPLLSRDNFYIPETFRFNWQKMSVDDQRYMVEKSGGVWIPFSEYKISNYQTCGFSHCAGETFKFPQMEFNTSSFIAHNGCEYHYLGSELMPIADRAIDFNRNVYLKQVIGAEKILPMLMSSCMEAIAEGRFGRTCYPAVTPYQYWEKGKAFWRHGGLSAELHFSASRFSTKMPQKSAYGLGLPDPLKEVLASKDTFWHRLFPGAPWLFLRQDANKNFYEQPQQYVLIDN